MFRLFHSNAVARRVSPRLTMATKQNPMIPKTGIARSLSSLQPDTSSLLQTVEAMEILNSSLARFKVPLPEDEQVWKQDPSDIVRERIKELRVLLLSNSFNSMTQRTYLELTETYQQDVRIEIAINEQQMLDSVQRHNPDVILCPFLTKRIPEKIWRDTSRLCLVVHPGIHGDRGASSIDWALNDKLPEWGVTVLQADEEMDAGPIWATKNFPVSSNTTKSAMYGSAVVDSAMEAIHEAMEKIVTGQQGVPLDYSDPNVKGTLRENMKYADRSVDFNQSANEVVRIVQMSDSSPGAPCILGTHKVFLYNCQVDSGDKNVMVQPGTITGQRNGAVRIACGSGSIWVTHMKGRGKGCVLPRIKLPATSILPEALTVDVPEITEEDDLDTHDVQSSLKDLWSTVPSASGVAVIHFPFLNGAMSTDQCKRLTKLFKKTCARDDVEVIILAGGASCWSNGINLNTVEAAADPAQESWENINAINDFVKAVFSATHKVTVAALQGNAGAGGAMAALACDYIWAHEKVVLNPHYKSMGLHGSEYWTYFLPKRVGHDKAQEQTNKCLPVSAKTAENMGMIDKILTSERTAFMGEVVKHGTELSRNASLLENIRTSKLRERTNQWHDMMETTRNRELRIMRENFANPEYNQARRNFVYKHNPTATPLHLSLNNYLNGKKEEGIPPALRMDGRLVSKHTLIDLKKKVDSLRENGGGTPTLSVLVVSGNEDSERYVSQKAKASKKVGIETAIHRFQDDAKDLEEAIIDRIEQLNAEENVNGIMVQLPLPPCVNKQRVLGAISPTKDVDGFAATNIGSIFGGNTQAGSCNFVPCTAKGIMSLLDHYAVPLTGKHVCIIGRSCIVGLPTQLALMGRGATVTNCDCNTGNLAKMISDADIVIASAGSPELVKAEWIKHGAVVVDVGFHVMNTSEEDEEKILGDVDARAVTVASRLTPVPGGVGPMTVAALLENTVDAFEAQWRV